MTDQLETDLRALLAERASGVLPDAAAGEDAIARRLATGDADLAEVVSVRTFQRHPWLIAAAVALVVIVGAAVVMSRDEEPNVTAGPSTSAPVGSTAVLEFRPVITGGDEPACDVETGGVVLAGEGGTTCYLLGDPLPGNELLADAQAVSLTLLSQPPQIGGYGVALTFTPDGTERLNVLAQQCYERSALCPSGRLAIVVDEIVVSAPSVLQPAFRADDLSIDASSEAEANALADALRPRGAAPQTTTTLRGAATATTVGTGSTSSDDPTVGHSGESAKDVAERVMSDVMGDEAVTLQVADRADGEVVVMETASGVSVFAFVTFDDALGAHRLVGLQTGKFEVFDDQGHVSIPDEGRLAIFRRATLIDEPEALVADLPIDHPGTDHGPFDLPEDGWLQMFLVTEDGQMLHHLSRR